MKRDTNKILERIWLNGWCPVPYADQPAKVKLGIRLAGIRPAAKQCYANAQRLMLRQSVVPFRYVEGIVESIIPIEHAWLTLDGERVDVTLPDRPKVLASYEVDADDVRIAILKNQRFGPVDENRLGLLRYATMFGFPTNQPVEELQKQVTEELKQLRSRHGVL